MASVVEAGLRFAGMSWNLRPLRPDAQSRTGCGRWIKNCVRTENGITRYGYDVAPVRRASFSLKPEARNLCVDVDPMCPGTRRRYGLCLWRETYELPDAVSREAAPFAAHCAVVTRFAGGGALE